MIERLYLLFEVLALLTGLFALHEKKTKPSIISLVYVAVDLILATSIDMGWLPKGMELLLYVGLIFLCMYEFKDKVYDSCLYAVLDILLIGIVQMFCALILFLIMQTLYAGTVEYQVVNLVVLIILLLVYKYGSIYKFMQPLLNNGIIGRIILSVIAVICLTIFIIFKQHDIVNWRIAVEMFVFVIAFSLILFQWQKEKWMNRQKEAEAATFERYNEIYKDLIQEVRRRQHDFNNHLQAIFSMNALADNLEELVEAQNEYCAKLIAENAANKLLKEYIPSVLAGFFYTKLGQAEKQGITVKYRLVVDEIEKHISFADLVEIIGNLFDNSMEAVLHEEDKLMECYVEQDEEELTIEISNPCAFKSAPELRSLTEDGKSTKGEDHGLGLGNVKRTVEKYGGILEMKCVDKLGINFIIFRVRIPLEQ